MNGFGVQAAGRTAAVRLFMSATTSIPDCAQYSTNSEVRLVLVRPSTAAHNTRENQTTTTALLRLY
jgi:hypothetical protein